MDFQWFYSRERIVDSVLAGWFWPIAPEKTFYHAVLRGANIVTVTDTIVLSFATRYDIFGIVVKMPPPIMVAGGGIGWD